MPEEEWLQSENSDNVYKDVHIPDDLNLTGAQSLKQMEEEYNKMTKDKGSFTHD